MRHAPAVGSRGRSTIVALGLVCLMIGALIAAGKLEGRAAVVAPLVLGLLLTVPGDLLRRALFRGWPVRTADVMAVDVVASCTVLIVVGGLLARFGVFRLAPLVAMGSATLVVLVVISEVRRREPRPSIVPAVVGFSTLVILGALGLCLFHIEPQIGDRIFLGQYQITKQFVDAGRVPSHATAFDAETDFPSHYLFLNALVGSASILAGLRTWADYVRLAAALRLVQFGLFGLGWFVAGRAMLRSHVRSTALLNCAASTLPVLLLFNAFFRSKFREPLAEGLAIGLVGIAVWAVIEWTSGRSDSHRRHGLVAATTLGVLAGLHIPGFVAGAFAVGAWLLVAPMTGATTQRSSPGAVPRSRWFRVTVGRIAVVLLAGSVAGLAFSQVLSGEGGLAGLATGAVESGRLDQVVAYRALLLMTADPLSQVTAHTSIITRRWNADVMLASEHFLWIGCTLAAVAAIGLVIARRRGSWRVPAWCAATAALNVGYVATGVLFGGDAITPWNAITRNSFYTWLPLALFAIYGLAVFGDWIFDSLARSRVGYRTATACVSVLTLVLISVVIIPVWQRDEPFISAHGWLIPHQISPDGERALAWVADNTPAGAMIMTSEITYGSELIANRPILTEGKATIESPTVTRAAIATLTPAYELFMPVHSPKILIDHPVRYIVVGDVTGLYYGGRLGGTPMLERLTPRLAPVAATLPLDNLPYLERVQTFGAVAIYAVHPDRLPSLQVDHVDSAASGLPECKAEACLTYVPVAQGAVCPPEQLSTERDVCLIRRTAG